MQFGRPFTDLGNGKKSYVTPEGRLVCEHGELSSTICHWIADEAKAEREGKPVTPRGGSRGNSICDCCSTFGLNTKLGSDVELPEAPTSLYEFLEEQDAEMVYIKGIAARKIPHLPGPTFVNVHGRLSCRHGASRASLNKKEKCDRPSTRLPSCGCVLKPLPVRTAFKGVKLGKTTKPVLKRIDCTNVKM